MRNVDIHIWTMTLQLTFIKPLFSWCAFLLATFQQYSVKQFELSTQTTKNVCTRIVINAQHGRTSLQIETPYKCSTFGCCSTEDRYVTKGSSQPLLRRLYIYSMHDWTIETTHNIAQRTDNANCIDTTGEITCTKLPIPFYDRNLTICHFVLLFKSV